MHQERRRDSESSSGGSSTDDSSPDFAPVVLDLTDARRPSDASEYSSVSDERRPSGVSTDSSLLVYSRRPSGLSAFQEVDESLPPRVEVIEEGVELLDAVDEEKIAPRPVVARDFACLTIPPPAFSRRGSSDHWAHRLRRSQGNLSRSPSTHSLSALASPRSSLAMLPSPSALMSPSTPNLAGTPSNVGTPTEEMPFTNPWSRRTSRTGRTLDQAINFDRIRSPMLSPAASLPDIGKVREFDAQRPPTSPYATVALQSPRPGLGSHRGSSSSSFSSSSEGEEDDEENEYGLGPPPEVPPALEYVDPEIECIAPNASTVTLPQAEAQVLEQSITHPWVEPPFNIVERKKPTINKYTATFKIVVSLGAVSSLLIGYGLGVKLVSVGPWSFGMYGLILIVGTFIPSSRSICHSNFLADFITQTIAASYNRRRVNKLTAASPLVKGVAERLAAKDELPTTELAPLPEASIAVVGYREDEEAWVAVRHDHQMYQPIAHSFHSA